MKILRRIRDVLLPKTARPRTIPLGIGRGIRTIIDFHWDTAFYFGIYESELNPHIRRLVQHGTRVFDVGGYRGWDALAFAKLSDAAVVTFDGSPSCIKHMKECFAINPWFDIMIVPKLVGCESNSNRTTLDDAATMTFFPEFLKIDIEGGEYDALQGALECLSHRPSLIVEVHSVQLERDCVAFLRELGFSVQIVDRKKKVLGEARGIEHNRWLVCEPEKASRSGFLAGDATP